MNMIVVICSILIGTFIGCIILKYLFAEEYKKIAVICISCFIAFGMIYLAAQIHSNGTINLPL